LTLAVAAGLALAWVVAAAGPADTVTAATTGSSTSSGGSAITRTETKTITEPARTDTVTETSTAQEPGNTTSITNRTATVQVTPASTTTDQSDSSGLPAWGWVLIGLGAVLIGLVMFMLGRHRSSPAGGPADSQRPPAPGAGTHG
jgi:hypothetical protein